MPNIPLTRLRQGFRTVKFPYGPPPPLPDRLRCKPVLDPSLCRDGCGLCVKACPTGAILPDDSGKPAKIDLGKCIFCLDCSQACPNGSITLGTDYRMATGYRGDLVADMETRTITLAEQLKGEAKRLFGRSLRLRQVSAGGCNACESDVNVLGTIGWDLGRFGIQFVASPRHADGILVTGPVTPNMTLALRKTWDAIPEPKLVIAVGACAISGGLYSLENGAQSGLGSEFKVDLYIPGCPPHPLTILDGLLRLLGKTEDQRKAGKRP